MPLDPTPPSGPVVVANDDAAAPGEVEIELVDGWRSAVDRVLASDAPFSVRLPSVGPSDADRGAAIARLTEAVTLGPAAIRVVDAADAVMVRRVLAVVAAVSAASGTGARMGP